MVWCQDCGLLDDDGRPAEKDGVGVPRFLNRILGLPVAQQNSLFGYFMEMLEVEVRNAKAAGTYDRGINLIRGRSVTFDANAPKHIDPSGLTQSASLATGSSSTGTSGGGGGAGAGGGGGLELQYWKCRVDRGLSFQEAMKLFTVNKGAEAQANLNRRVVGIDMRSSSRRNSGNGNNFTGFYKQIHVFAGRPPSVVLASLLIGSETAFGSSKCRIWRPGTGELKMPMSDFRAKYKSIPMEQNGDAQAGLKVAEKLWRAEFADRAKNCFHGSNCKNRAWCTAGKRMLDKHILGGAVVPLWGAIEQIVNQDRYRPKVKFTIVRAEEKSATEEINFIEDGDVTVLDASGALAVGSSSSSSSGSTLPLAAPKSLKQCIGIEIREVDIETVLYGLENGIHQ